MNAVARKIGVDVLGRRRHETRIRDSKVVLHTEQVLGHVHCAVFDEDGDGYTSPGPDGHRHRISQLELTAAGGHTHELSTSRCTHEHDSRGHHVEEP